MGFYKEKSWGPNPCKFLIDFDIEVSFLQIIFNFKIRGYMDTSMATKKLLLSKIAVSSCKS